MTAGEHPGPDQLALDHHGADTALAQLSVIRCLYAEVYAEPPYREGPADVADFAGGWPQRVGHPGFRLVIASWGVEPIGFGFGHQLPVRTGWWDGALTPLPDDITAEYPGRTFAIIEMAVRRRYRRRCVARRLHAELTAGRPEERITLLVRPDAPAPQRAYRSWDYRPVGRIRPFPEGPVYDAMIRSCVTSC
ncbi:MAG: GNAT family N-acetyltransferase [Actinomycetota bacterium]|nr:GNAT family N-acetyltransferase [Actinomycetota bacterium]